MASSRKRARRVDTRRLDSSVVPKIGVEGYKNDNMVACTRCKLIKVPRSALSHSPCLRFPSPSPFP
jgi:hypothetical protein